MPANRNQFEASCPACGHANRFRLRAEALAALTASGQTRVTELVNCDSEEGGCDEAFAFDVTAQVTYNVKVFALAAPKPKDAPDADRRLWTVRSKIADNPSSNLDEVLIPEHLRERAKRFPLYALALEMKDGDSLDFVSVDALTSFHITCEEVEAARTFGSFRDACRVARNDARDTGQTHNVFFDGEAFRVYPDDADTFHFELVLVVAPPIRLKITVGERAGDHKGTYQAQVYSDDERANPDLQQHGDNEIFVTPVDAHFETPAQAARDAADWIRAQFPTLDVDIQSDFDVEADDIPL